ncbi:hypothetical protein [Acinetobacter johnsonii]|uniref:hypothetical protein n=1 Tax=Acinetobacter johnsonii TaxID=40214 RepID=UPI001D0E8891|nr:hypothetical protein [Acinetobacter johnsonii]
MAINYDLGGFIIGERRAKEIADGVNQTNDTTKQILDFLKNTMTELKATAEASAKVNKSDLDRQNRHGKSVDATSKEAVAVRKVVDASESLAKAVEKVKNTAQGLGAESSGRLGGVSGTRERSEQARERDSKGRFIGAAGAKESRSFFDFIGKAKDFMSGNGGVDVSGVDPTIDALREVKDVVSPVGRVFGGMGARAIGLFRGRLKKRRGDELLPKEQVDANKEQQRNDKQRNKLLKRLIDVVQANSGGGLGDLLGGRGALGLLGGLGKAGLKRLPLIGALFGGASLAKDWDGLDTAGKGKGLGEVIGMTVGGVLGAFLGPVGAIGGAGLGQYLGGIFGNKVGKWVDELRTADLPTIFKELIKGVLQTNPVTGIPYRLGENAYGFGQSVRNWFGGGDSSSSGDDGGPVTRVGSLSVDKQKSISRVANNIGVAPNDLASIISFETAGTFSTKSKNPGSSATGLIQFMGKGATKRGGYNDGSYYGMSRDQFGALSFDEQMKYVEKYYKDRGFDGTKKRSLADAYTAVSGYGYKAGSKAYELNRAWDTDGNGVIDKGEAVRAPQFQAHRKKWIKSEEKPLNTAKAKAQEVPLFQRPANSGMAPIQVPKVTAELSKIGRNTTAQAKSSAPTDVGIGQTVSDRGLAHITSGGIGYDRYS